MCRTRSTAVREISPRALACGSSSFIAHRSSFIVCRSAFTLVELLVVIAVLEILAALLLPAIQSAREAARRSRCQNNLRHIGVAVQAHVTAHKYFPTNGWGFLWVGDPDRGFGAQQPGGWVYNILPFVEQEDLRRLGRRQPDEMQKRQLLTQLLQVEVPLF